MKSSENDYNSQADGADTEITLSVGKVLALFFGLVIMCGIALGVGYTLGRNSAKQAAANAAPAVTVPAPVSSGPAKPGASQAAPLAQPKVADDAPAAPVAAPGNPADMTFSKSLQQKDEHPKLTPAEKPAPPPAPAPEAHLALGAGYMVQIAAVRNQDDARLMSDTLKKQHYPVVIVQPSDKLYHVQVGPYADAKEAEAIRARLIAAGFNAFVKR